MVDWSIVDWPIDRWLIGLLVDVWLIERLIG
jgi:hypothetical protein